VYDIPTYHVTVGLTDYVCRVLATARNEGLELGLELGLS
jgi:hypothetical protein